MADTAQRKMIKTYLDEIPLRERRPLGQGGGEVPVGAEKAARGVLELHPLQGHYADRLALPGGALLGQPGLHGGHDHGGPDQRGALQLHQRQRRGGGESGRPAQVHLRLPHHRPEHRHYGRRGPGPGGRGTTRRPTRLCGRACSSPSPCRSLARWWALSLPSPWSGSWPTAA